jgi:hypothetical protein
MTWRSILALNKSWLGSYSKQRDLMVVALIRPDGDLNFVLTQVPESRPRDKRSLFVQKSHQYGLAQFMALNSNISIAFDCLSAHVTCQRCSPHQNDMSDDELFKQRSYIRSLIDNLEHQHNLLPTNEADLVTYWLVLTVADAHLSGTL